MGQLKFAIISEGVSEHNIIKHILQRYCDEEPIINQLQPQIIDDKQNTPGGWNEVLKYCERETDLQEALRNNDYIVIQIDTDMCETAPYSVSKQEQDRTLSEEELCNKVSDRIMNSIPQSIDNSRILLAISSEIIECWLLPIYCTSEAAKRKVLGCLEQLNHELRRNNEHVITDKNSDLAKRTYRNILKLIKKPKNIEECAKYHYGFSSFLEQISKCKESPKSSIFAPI